MSVQIYLVMALLFFNKYLQFWIIALSVSNCMTLLIDKLDAYYILFFNDMHLDTRHPRARHIQ